MQADSKKVKGDLGISLSELLTAWRQAVHGTRLPQPPAYDGPDVWLTSIVEHTDAVTPGACFVARVRSGSDGHPYIGQAIARGASLIVGQRPLAELPTLQGVAVPYLRVPDSGLAEAWLAASWEDFPARDLVMIGVTGTDGKTTTANLLYTVLQESGIAAGLLSTLRAVIGPQEEPLALHVTTPEAPVIQRYLRRMVDAGLTHCVLETTSHGLAQHRVAAIDFDVAVVTNITHEHLDYHGSWEAYLEAKAQLFRTLAMDAGLRRSANPFKEQVTRTAVLNGDDVSFAHLRELPVARRLVYRMGQTADVSAIDPHYGPDATRFMLHISAGPSESEAGEVVSPLVGDFNVYNMLAAATAAHSLGLSLPEIQRGLRRCQPLTGRMQRIAGGQPFLVIVDFAHTPNALAEAIRAGRRMVSRRVITLFGSAGKRDVQKRRLMAEISARESDLTILTAEDPRTESLDEILEMMAAGCREMGGVEGKSFWRVPDRGQAIYFALQLARPDDLVLICGKGHEQSMCFGVTEYPWDDAVATRTALEALQTRRPMPDLGLPTFRTPR